MPAATGGLQDQEKQAGLPVNSFVLSSTIRPTGPRERQFKLALPAQFAPLA
jgi:hypothetical protein